MGLRLLPKGAGACRVGLGRCRQGLLSWSGPHDLPPCQRLDAGGGGLGEGTAAKVETPMRHDDHHSQVLHLGVELEKAKAAAAPRHSARLASSFLYEILTASRVLAATLVSSVERTSITTMRSGFWKSATAEPSLRDPGFDTTSNGIVTPWAGHFVGYVGEESPVEGAWFEEEKSSCSKRAILALLSSSSFKRFSLSSSCFSLSSSRFSLSSDSILSCFVRCSMS